jgi:prevent-host-death family protein
MKRVGAREFKNKLGSYIAEVRRGRSLIITMRGKAVAKVNPIPAAEDSDQGLRQLLEKLESEGKIRLGRRPLKPFRPVPGRGKSASQMIIEDRR